MSIGLITQDTPERAVNLKKKKHKKNIKKKNIKKQTKKKT